MFSATSPHAAAVVPLRSRQSNSPALAEAIDVYLSTAELAATTRRVYGVVLAKLVADLGGATAMDTLGPEAVAEAVLERYQAAAPATRNRVVATLSSFFSFATRQGWVSASPAAGLSRRRSKVSRETLGRTKAIPLGDLEAFLRRPQWPLRERLLWRLLYETAARANEILGLDVEDLDLPNRRAAVLAKGGNAETVGWETASARLLPRYLRGRTSGPLFLTAIAPAPARQPARGDADPSTGRARLSYRRAASIFDTATEGRWTLHQLRHSRLTELAEAGLSAPMLQSKSRHTSIRSLSIYARPSFEAVARATAALDPSRHR